jgi:hypothetical protein
MVVSTFRTKIKPKSRTTANYFLPLPIGIIHNALSLPGIYAIRAMPESTAASQLTVRRIHSRARHDANLIEPARRSDNMIQGQEEANENELAKIAMQCQHSCQSPSPSQLLAIPIV